MNDLIPEVRKTVDSIAQLNFLESLNIDVNFQYKIYNYFEHISYNFHLSFDNFISKLIRT